MTGGRGHPCSLPTAIVRNKVSVLLLQSLFVIDVGIRHLRSFLAVADELHFGRAAKRMGIAQSAVSQQIRRLEGAVGAQLLTRTSRRVTLTPAGQILREGAERVVADLDRVAARTRAAQAERSARSSSALRVPR